MQKNALFGFIVAQFSIWSEMWVSGAALIWLKCCTGL